MANDRRQQGRTAIDVIESALERRRVNCAEEAARLHVSVICNMIGRAEPGLGFHAGPHTIAFSDVSDADKPEVAAAQTDIFPYYDALMHRRQEHPQDDIISPLAHGGLDGRPATTQKIVLNCDNLVSSGNKTTRHATIAGLLTFIGNPIEWNALSEQPELLRSAVREIPRHTTPAIRVLRTATRDVDLAGGHMAMVSMVTLWQASANRDEAALANPDRFDIRRSPNRHLTYADGAHFCDGAALASTVRTIHHNELPRRAQLAELSGDVVLMRSNLIGGIERGPVVLTRGPGAPHSDEHRP